MGSDFHRECWEIRGNLRWQSRAKQPGFRHDPVRRVYGLDPSLSDCTEMKRKSGQREVNRLGSYKSLIYKAARLRQQLLQAQRSLNQTLRATKGVTSYVNLGEVGES